MILNTIIRGDALEVLRTLPDESVHCVVTSPPYWRLRDYGVDGQIGLEDTPQAFVARLVEVFREIRRVLRLDGTCWVNMGDTWQDKQIVGSPWRLAFALQDDGWWLRSEIIWAKPNPMPSSVKDRPACAHETIFLLSRSAKYFYDHEAVKEPRVQDEDAKTFRGGCYVNGCRDNFTLGKRTVVGNRKVQAWPQGWAVEGKHDSMEHARATKRRTVRPCDTRGEGQGSGEMTYPAYTRNLRSVWTIPTYPFPEAHFATFPPRLAETCIKAGCPAGGVVLDPFSGSGTTCMVAAKLGRAYLGIELNQEYADLATRRIAHEAGQLLALAAEAK